jgi:hypothetical protein
MMGKKKPDRQKRLTPDEIDRIVSLKLDRVRVSVIAREVDCDPKTVQLWWHKWLDDASIERRAQLERSRTEQIARFESVAIRSRQGANRVRADDSMEPDAIARAEAKYLSEERQAVRDLCKVAGFDAPIQIGVKIDTMTDVEADAILAAL